MLADLLRSVGLVHLRDNGLEFLGLRGSAYERLAKRVFYDLGVDMGVAAVNVKPQTLRRAGNLLPYPCLSLVPTNESFNRHGALFTSGSPGLAGFACLSSYNFVNVFHAL